MKARLPRKKKKKMKKCSDYKYWRFYNKLIDVVSVAYRIPKKYLL